MAQLLGIAKHRQARGELETLDSTQVTLAEGVVGDFRGKPGKRQVTVLSREAWQTTCDELGETLVWTARRANLLVEGLSLGECAGKVIKIGELELLITRETDPCERMDEVREGLFAIMKKEWRGGVCCQVVKSGQIAVGDNVELIDVN